MPWVNGVKTGHTQQAAEVLVGSGRKRGIQVISAVLDEKDKATRNADTVRLLSFGSASSSGSPPRPSARRSACGCRSATAAARSSSS